MRNSLAIVFFVVLTMLGCKPSVPSEYVQPGDLEDILYDYHVAQAMANESQSMSGEERNYHQNAYFHAVLKKYGVSEAEFDSSLVYYYSHADRLRGIYQRVKERLNDEIAKMQKGDMQSVIYSEYNEQFQVFGIIVIILLILEVLISEAQNPWLKKVKLFKK